MNVLKQEKKELVLNLLTEGNTLRGIQRLTGIHRETTIRLIRNVGENCERFMDKKMKYLRVNYLQCDEVAVTLFKRQANLKKEDKNGDWGLQWIFIAIDAETKIVPTYVVGKRTAQNAYDFIQDVQSRIIGHFQLTTDSFNGYKTIDTMGLRRRASYARLIKVFREHGYDKKQGYSPAKLVRQTPSVIFGKPDPKHISTSLIERQNLTLRQQMRRFARLTNAFSKKLDCLKRALAIHFYWYNFCRLHETIRVTPRYGSGDM